MNDSFAQDVVRGLSSPRKFLASKYFYDARGDELFQKIMELDEYYLTNCEFEIFESYKEDILKIFNNPVQEFQILEFGAGDGLKTKILLQHFLDKKANFTYSPIDISGSVLKHLDESLRKEMPELNFQGIKGDYFEILKQFSRHSDATRNIVLFMGANIGNFADEVRREFVQKVRQNLELGDLFMVGFDLKKDPSVILQAYNDPEGVTREFNLNLLSRMNRELGANFNIEKFLHYPFYNPQTGESRSYLISTEDQEVYFKEMDKTFFFERWEAIFTEVSKKFTLTEIRNIGATADFEVVAMFHDSKEYFVEVIFKAV